MEYVCAQGIEIPALGFGTWQMPGEECRKGVESALDLGYRHIDTAQLYENESAVGAAVSSSGVDRGDLFLVTKILRRNLAYDDVLESIAASRNRLGTDIDLLLIHAPSRSIPIPESIEAMNRLQDEGTVSHIGVSNFSKEQLRVAMDASRTPILTNQVPYHPLRSQDELLEFCVDHDVMLTAYSPLARGDVVGNDELAGIGDRYGKTAAQVALRWLVQQELVSAIPKASSRAHREENIDIFDFELTAGEMERIHTLS